MQEHRVQLRDGRTMACAEYGDPSSERTLVGNHGTGSSRLEMAMYDDTFADAGLRVLAPERPGYGDSSPDVTGRELAAWGDDVATMVEQLGVATFAVSGYSGGGRHALAAAASPALRGRVERVLLISATAPDQPPLNRHDAVMRQRMRECSWNEFSRSYESGIMDELANVAPADEEAFADPSYVEAAMATVTEGLKQGGLGEASDEWSGFKPWGFALASIAQPVDVWHGDVDTIVPVHHARALVAALPNASLHILAGEGHFSIGRFLPEFVEVLATSSH